MTKEGMRNELVAAFAFNKPVLLIRRGNKNTNAHSHAQAGEKACARMKTAETRTTHVQENETIRSPGLYFAFAVVFDCVK